MQLHMHDAISYPHPHPRVVEAAHGEETRREEGRWRGAAADEGVASGTRREGVASIPTAVCHYSSLSTYQIAQQ